MLYPHAKDQQLTPELFQHPGSEYRGTPFWAWNCKLEKDELLWQLEVLKKMGLGGAHMHVRTGMTTPYLSEEHMDLISACVEKCREENMLAWLYDEDRWPSGAAGGLLTKDPQYRARHLVFTACPNEEAQTEEEHSDSSARSLRSCNGYLLACYDVVLDENGCLESARKIDKDTPVQGRKWYAYVESDVPNPWYNNQTYANTLDKKTIEAFVKLTHEKYFEKVGKDFGGVVPAIFTDEPQFPHKGTLAFAKEVKDVILPWSDDVPETYKNTYGEDILDKLPELFWELPNGKVSLARYHYHDHISERFASAFADTCGDWCAKHGLMLTGHMMEEPTLKSQTAALGDCMRSYRSFQLPGIDMLCNSFEFTTAKQAQSAAHQYARPGVLSELYGVTGWDFDFRGHKLQGDWQAALGVTVRVQHLSWVSMKGEAKRDYPASIHYQSPWWQDYSFVEDHFARVNTALTRGKPLVKVGVIHPVESYWLHWGPAEQTIGVREEMDAHFQDLTKWLLFGSVDFDFISESLLPTQCNHASAPLQVGQMAYDAILVPGCETLRASTLEILEKFQKAGGKLIFLGDAPKYVDAVESDTPRKLYELSEKAQFSRESVLEALENVRILDIRNEDGSRTDNLVHQLRTDGDKTWLFIAHGKMPACKDIPAPQDIRISVKGKHSIQIYDTLNGAILPAEYTFDGQNTVMHTVIYEEDSLLLCYDKAENEQEVFEGCIESHHVRTLPVSKKVNFRLDEPNVLLMDKAEYAVDDGEYQPEMEILRADNAIRQMLGWKDRTGGVVQPWVMPDDPITHHARLRFTVHSTMEVTGAHFALEDADIASVTVNGQPIPNAADGYFTDKCIQTLPLPVLPKGDSVIEVTVPFGKRSNLEWCYLLGNFGVEIAGEYRELIPMPESLGFDNIVLQKLPHYGGNIHYDLPIETTGGAVSVQVPQYDGTAVRVSVDGEQKGYIAYSPYVFHLENLPAGHHTLTLTLLGNRVNCFGPVHWAHTTATWNGPESWRSQNTHWTESYRLRSIGIRSKPIITEYK